MAASHGVGYCLSPVLLWQIQFLCFDGNVETSVKKKKGFYHDNTDIIGHMMVVSLTDDFSTVCLILHGDSQMAKVRCDQT